MDALSHSDSILNPLDRAAEVLFGLIMALSFTCSISVATAHRAEIRHLLVGALGCNLAWGLVDALMYLVGVLAYRNRNRRILEAIQRSSENNKARKYIAESLPPVVAAAVETEELERIRSKLAVMKDAKGREHLTGSDIKKAFAIFCLVFISTLPVALPFVMMQNIKTALRLSNLIAILMMFLCGWSVAGYTGFSKWKMSFAMIFIGILLVTITVVLGG